MYSFCAFNSAELISSLATGDSPDNFVLVRMTRPLDIPTPLIDGSSLLSFGDMGISWAISLSYWLLSRIALTHSSRSTSKRVYSRTVGKLVPPMDGALISNSYPSFALNTRRCIVSSKAFASFGGRTTSLPTRGTRNRGFSLCELWKKNIYEPRSKANRLVQALSVPLAVEAVLRLYSLKTKTRHMTIKLALRGDIVSCSRQTTYIELKLTIHLVH